MYRTNAFPTSSVACANAAESHAFASFASLPNSVPGPVTPPAPPATYSPFHAYFWCSHAALKRCSPSRVKPVDASSKCRLSLCYRFTPHRQRPPLRQHLLIRTRMGRINANAAASGKLGVISDTCGGSNGQRNVRRGASGGSPLFASIYVSSTYVHDSAGPPRPRQYQFPPAADFCGINAHIAEHGIQKLASGDKVRLCQYRRNATGILRHQRGDDRTAIPARPARKKVLRSAGYRLRRWDRAGNRQRINSLFIGRLHIQMIEAHQRKAGDEAARSPYALRRGLSSQFHISSRADATLRPARRPVTRSWRRRPPITQPVPTTMQSH